MSATNQTANYGLSQFIGTDVPGWLSDYNSDNAKIDTAIFAAKSAADAAATTAGQAATDITSINQTLTTQAAQISAAAQSASQAQTSAGQALNTAQQADGKADTNTTAISGLDSRVTALESGSGGLSSDTVTFTNESYKVYTPPTGKKPIAVSVTDTTFNDPAYLGLMAEVYKRGSDYIIALLVRNASTGGAALSGTPATVTVLLV